MATKKRDTDQTLWDSLNERQQHYLQAIYTLDQEKEEYYRRKGAKGDYDHTPASQWRWIAYHSAWGPSRLQMAIGLDNIDQGTGSTFEALEKRGLIETNGSKLTALDVKITPLGRRLIRLNDPNYTPTPKRPVGFLQEWQWEALVYLYTDGFLVSSDGTYRRPYVDYFSTKRITWKTILRLRDYEPEPLLRETRWDKVKEEFVTSHYSNMSYTLAAVRITAAGRYFYKRHYEAYRAEYPGIEAPIPKGNEPPHADALTSAFKHELKSWLADVKNILAGRFPDLNRNIELRETLDWVVAGDTYFRFRSWDTLEGNYYSKSSTYVNVFTTLPTERENFLGLCAFCDLTPEEYPALLEHYPLPGSDLERFAADCSAWLDANPHNPIGEWSEKRFRRGRPIQTETFYDVCHYMGFNAEDYPTLNTDPNYLPPPELRKPAIQEQTQEDSREEEERRKEEEPRAKHRRAVLDGMEAARRAGKHVGRPVGTKATAEKFLQTPEAQRVLRAAENVGWLSVRKMATAAQVAPNTVQKVRRALQDVEATNTSQPESPSPQQKRWSEYSISELAKLGFDELPPPPSWEELNFWQQEALLAAHGKSKVKLKEIFFTEGEAVKLFYCSPGLMGQVKHGSSHDYWTLTEYGRQMVKAYLASLDTSVWIARQTDRWLHGYKP